MGSIDTRRQTDEEQRQRRQFNGSAPRCARTKAKKGACPNQRRPLCYFVRFGSLRISERVCGVSRHALATFDFPSSRDRPSAPPVECERGWTRMGPVGRAACRMWPLTASVAEGTLMCRLANSSRASAWLGDSFRPSLEHLTRQHHSTRQPQRRLQYGNHGCSSETVLEAA